VRLWWLVGASLVSHISLFLVLLLALRHVGVSGAQVSWAEALGAFAFIRFLSALPITPGGLGIIELGLSAALAYAGGPRVEVVAAVLVFRAVTYLVQIPFGAITYAYWQHSDRWKRPQGGEDTMLDVG
jgi:putative heme transporter